MIITATIRLDHKQLDEETIQIEGKMSSITMLAEEWQPSNLTLVSFTEDDEL